MSPAPVRSWLSSTAPVARDADNVATYCVLCNHNCGIRVDVRDGQIRKVRPDASNPFSRGHMCNKGATVGLLHNHAQRVRHPLRRRADGSFERVSWDVAIAEISDQVRQIYDEHGAMALGAVGMGGQGNHLGGGNLLGLLEFLGSRRWFSPYGQEKTQHHLIEQWMFDAPHSMMFMPDAHRTHYLIEIGTNPGVSNLTRNHTEVTRIFRKEPQRKLVVVDPRVTDSVKKAHRHLQIRPGTDAYLLLAMAAALVQHDLVDEEWLAANSIGYERIRRQLAAVDIGDMARRCGIAAADIVQTATEFAQAPSAAIEAGLGAEHVWFSTFVSYLVRLILSVTKNAGRAGGNVFYGTLAPTLRFPDRFAEPPRTVAAGIRGIRALAPYHMFSPTLVPEEIEVDSPDRLRAIFVDSANPVISYQDTQRWRRALGKLDLLVVVETAMTETAHLADYVLPGASAYQKWEFADFAKRWPEIIFQLRQPLLPIRDDDDVLPESEIYYRLAKATGFFGDVPAELCELGQYANTPHGAAAYLMTAQKLAANTGDANPLPRLSYWTHQAVGPHLPSPAITPVWLSAMMMGMTRPELVKRSFGAAWQDRGPFELGLEVFRRILANPGGVEVGRFDPETTWTQDILGWEDKRIRLAPEPLMEEFRRVIDTDVGIPDPEYPIVLAAGVRTRWTANTIHRDASWRKGRGPHCQVHVNRGDADKLGIRHGALVAVTSRRGTVTVPATVDDGVQPGFAWLPNGFGLLHARDDGTEAQIGVNVNELTASSDRDPFTGCPHKKNVRCRIEPIT